MLTFRLFVVHCMRSAIRLEGTGSFAEPCVEQAATDADAILSAIGAKRIRMGIVLP